MQKTSILKKKPIDIKPRIRYFSLGQKPQCPIRKSYTQIQITNESQIMILKPIQQYLQKEQNVQTKIKLQYLLMVFKQHFNGIHCKSIAYLEALLLSILRNSQLRHSQFFMLKIIQNCEKISQISFKLFKQSKQQSTNQVQKIRMTKKLFSRQKMPSKTKSRSSLVNQQIEENKELFPSQNKIFPYQIKKKSSISLSKLFDMKNQHFFLKFLSSNIIQNKKMLIPFRQINGTDLYRDNYAQTLQQRRQIDLSYIRTQSIWLKYRCQSIKNNRDKLSFKNLQREFKINSGILKQKTLHDYLRFTKPGHLPNKNQVLKLTEVNRKNNHS